MKKMKKIYHYNTGEEIPKGAIYLNTITKVKTSLIYLGHRNHQRIETAEVVYHYFLVEEENVHKTPKNRK